MGEFFDRLGRDESGDLHDTITPISSFPGASSRVISEEISPAGSPSVTWLKIIDGHCREKGLAGSAQAWHNSLWDF